MDMGVAGSLVMDGKVSAHPLVHKVVLHICSVTAAGLLMIHLAAPQLYETSALGGWILAFLVFGGFFVRELISLFQQRKEGIIGGIAA